jgi:2-dehydrotetronate isomerase
MPRLAASVEMMFREVALLDRFAPAAAAGFRGVEIQNPYTETAEGVAARLRRHGLTAVLMNVLPAVAALPGHEAEFQQALSRALAYAQAAGCAQLHCLAGRTDHPGAEDTFVANLQWAAEEARPAGVRLLIEPLNTHDNPGYFLTRTAQARRILDRVARDEVRLQYDCYHMQIMEGDLAGGLRANRDAIGHVQIAGVPGRHEPDQAQEVDYASVLDLLDVLGYEGWVGCEYRPRAGTLEGLGWARRYGIHGGGA